MFIEAIELAPDFARAWSSLAAAYITLPVYADAAEAESYKRAEAAALRALEFDDSLAEAYAVLGDLASASQKMRQRVCGMANS